MYLTISLIANGLFTFLAIFGWQVMKELARESAQHRYLSAKMESDNTNLRVALSLLKQGGQVIPTTYDQKTISLIKLAVNNPNENERHAAAYKACLYIHKTLK